MAYIKSKKFEGVYQNPLKSGDISYYITYKDNENKTVTKKIGKKSEGVTEAYCSQLRAETITKLRIGELPPKIALQRRQNVVTLDELAKFYFDTKDIKSLKKFKGKYDLRIKSALGKKDVRYLTDKDMKAFQQKLISDGITPHTVNCYMDIVSTIVNHSIDSKFYSGHNPTKLVSKLKVDNKRERILTKSEVEDVLDAVAENWILNLFVRISLSTAARKGTVLNIKKCDVNLEDWSITLKDFKNDSTYIGYINDEILYNLLKNRTQMIGDNDLLFDDSDYTDMDGYIGRKLNQIFYYLFNHKLADPNDNKYKVVTHTLRHTVLSHLAMNGESVYTIKSISNHKSISMLERYVKLNPIIGKKPIQKLWK